MSLRVGLPRVEGLFRCHEIDRSEEHTEIGRIVVFTHAPSRSSACQPHVENLHRALRVQQQVGRFDVAMNDAAAVRIMQAARRLHDAREWPGESTAVPGSSTGWPDPGRARTP